MENNKLDKNDEKLLESLNWKQGHYKNSFLKEPVICSFIESEDKRIQYLIIYIEELQLLEITDNSLDLNIPVLTPENYKELILKATENIKNYNINLFIN